MIVVVDGRREAAQTIVLADPDDLGALSVTVMPGPDDEVAAALHALGRMQGDHVWIARATLERLAGERAADPAWRRSFEAMLAYAGAQGWLDGDGAVRAHLRQGG